MTDWLENFSFAGIKLAEGEKSLMRFAMSKERERIIKLLENPYYHHTFLGPRDVNDEPVILHDGECIGCVAISEIKGEQK